MYMILVLDTNYIKGCFTYVYIYFILSCVSGELIVTIGDIDKVVKAPKFPQYVPKKYRK